MPKPLLMLIGLVVATLVHADGYIDDVRAADGPSLRVMTFNIRYDNPGDGDNAWPNRKDKVASMIRLHQADIVGMQEALRNQIDDLAQRLPAFEWLGVGRQDGKDAGEFAPVFYRRDRLELLEKNTFWLSQTPEKPGSRSWDAALPRIVTWAKFKAKPLAGDASGNGVEFFVFNTHFDHQGVVARFESAKLLRAKAAEIAGDRPTIVIGDFNCRSDSPPYRWLVGKEPPPVTDAARSDGGTVAGEVLADAMLKSRYPHHGPTTTWNGFQALAPHQKIDHIFVRGPLAVEQHAVLADHWDGRFPSDHLPVLAEIVLDKDKAQSANDQ